MQIVIDIPKKTYEHIKADGGHGCFNIQEEDNFIVTKAIFDGKPLPKEHGDLIDRNALKDYEYHIPHDIYANYTVVSSYDINDAPTIIEADGGGDDDESM